MNTLLEQYLSTPEPPALGPGPRAGVQPAAALNRDMEVSLKKLGLSGTHRELVRALILLWHDHLDAAHEIVQDMETKDGSYVHAILHRREPDYGNAKYWFRRVGQHPCYDRLAACTSVLLEDRNASDLERLLLLRGQWDAFAFVDACETVAGEASGASRCTLLRAIQGKEFEILLSYLGSAETNNSC